MLDLASSMSSFLLSVFSTLVVIVDGHRENLLRLFLPDHVLVENLANLVAVPAESDLTPLRRLVTLRFLANDVVAELDTLVADEHGRTRDQLPHLVLALAAKAAVEKFFSADLVRHGHVFQL